MITYVVGDLFQSPAKVLVNAVNTVGVMGAGIAKEFKTFYPELFTQYQALCEQKQMKIGNLWLYKTPHKWVLNFPTKEHWRARTEPEYLDAGFKKFVATYAEKGITSISFPMLGGGKGALDWDKEVRPLMEAYLGALPITVYIHRYERDNPFATEARNPRTIKTWLSGLPQPIPFIKVWRDLGRLVKKQERFKMLDSDATFRVLLDDTKRRRVTIYPQGGEALFFSETMLVDAWTYIRETGYCMPHNLPSGLEAQAPYLFALLGGLDYVHPVLLSPDDKERHIGLHVVPPVERRTDNVTRVKVSQEQPHG